MPARRWDEYPDYAALDGTEIVALEREPDNAGLRTMVRYPLAAALASLSAAAAAAQATADDAAPQGPITSSGLTMNTAKMLARLTAGSGDPEEVNFAASAWTPVFNFANAGDLSVIYTTQFGYYVQIGQLIIFRMRLSFTPTYTTATGGLRISGAPGTPDVGNNVFAASVFEAIAYPAGTTSYVGVFASSNLLSLTFLGNGVSIVGASTTQFPSGSARNLSISGLYTIT